jgi:hypothetical protein
LLNRALDKLSATTSLGPGWLVYSLARLLQAMRRI